MTPELKKQAISLLRQALKNPTSDFRDGQWEAIAALIDQRSRLLIRSAQVIEPRKQVPTNALLANGLKGKIADNLRAEEGRALSLWGDAGWGEMVKEGKYRDNRFDDALVQGAVEMIQQWQLKLPTWVTCVPSLNRPDLVPD